LNVTLWKPFQASHSNSRPVITAAKTPFNLVTCGNQFEAAMAQLLDKMTDVIAFCKNAGPQALRLDYLNISGQLALYTPDFLARAKDGSCYLIEVKGRQDSDVALKARAAVEWCKSATTKPNPWQYLYVTEALFNSFSKDTISSLSRTAAPALAELIGEAETQQIKLTTLMQEVADNVKKSAVESFVAESKLASLPGSFKNSIEQAVELFLFCENREGFSFANVFTPLLKPLDTSCHSLIYNSLIDFVPTTPYEQREFFDAARGTKLDERGQNLKKTLVYKSGFSPIGLLKFCLSFNNKQENLPGVFVAVAKAFAPYAETDLLESIDEVNKFRNEYVAHQSVVLTDAKHARVNLKHWIDTIILLTKHVRLLQ
ncbi:MAG: Tn7 transposase TnsA N-terminal domain-containing protein, partial [Candidatus Obscuribacterales bacterium]|nr:Tn7 transposase TnsA N-terminal domain-containing protein [Candidatus Obscuribacterales bacterium]